MYKTYILQKKVSRYALQIAVGASSRFITFVTIGFGTNYSTGYPRFSTTKADLQEAIEKSEMYESGMIRLESAVKEDAAEKTGKSGKGETGKGVKTQLLPQGKATGPDPNPDPDDEDINGDPDPEENDDDIDPGDEDTGRQGTTEYPEVTTYQEAKEILRDEYEVLAKELKNPAMILGKAAEMEISFPNLKAEQQ